MSRILINELQDRLDLVSLTRLAGVGGGGGVTIFDTQTTLLMAALTDGVIAYAKDTDNFWFRFNGTWGQVTQGVALAIANAAAPKIYATEATLLADSQANGTFAYAQDTGNFWFRYGGAWSLQSSSSLIPTAIYATEAALLAATPVNGAVGYAQDTSSFWFRYGGAWHLLPSAGLNVILVYVLQATLLAATPADGSVGYAQDTDNFWFRFNGGWHLQSAASLAPTLLYSTETALLAATPADGTWAYATDTQSFWMRFNSSWHVPSSPGSGLNSEHWGDLSSTGGSGAVALGKSASADGSNSIAIGYGVATGGGSGNTVVGSAPSGLTSGIATATLVGAAPIFVSLLSGDNNGLVAIGANIQVGFGSPGAGVGASVVIGAGLRINRGCLRTVMVGAPAATGPGTDTVDNTSLGVAAWLRSGSRATAIGSAAQVNGSDSVAVGASAQALGTATAIGSGAFSQGNGTAIGKSASASDTNAMAIGASAVATQPNTTAIGTSATSVFNGSVAIGNSARAAQTAVVIGYQAGNNGAGHTTNNSIEATAVGYQTRIGGFSVAYTGPSCFGYSTEVNANYGMALGHTAKVALTHTEAIALGRNAITTAANRLTVGTIGGANMMEVQFGKGLGAWGVAPPGTQPAHIINPTGGGTIDAESRAAITSILLALEGCGLVASV